MTEETPPPTKTYLEKIQDSPHVMGLMTFIATRKKTFITFIFALLMLYVSFIQAPNDFPTKVVFTVDDGATLSEVVDKLEYQNIIRSSTALKGLVTILGNAQNVFSGDYFFKSKKNVFQVAHIITTGSFDLTPVKITVAEGATIDDMAIIFGTRLPSFDRELFLEKAKVKEGFLFPDTYKFLPNAEAEEVIEKLENTFRERILGIEAEVNAFGKPVEDVVIMASILEKEARTTESRRIIAGILWKRLSIGMPLQVDAVFGYILGKGTFQLTLDDLKIDSPYNTYKYKGLPVGPIASPGLDSLKSAVTPIETDYFFYLSDLEGEMHYSETFEQHKANKRRYF